jgi:hypothetical protein
LILGGRYGMYFGSSAVGVYLQLTDNVIADNLKHGLFIGSTSYTGHVIKGNSFVRSSCGSGVTDNPSNVYFSGSKSVFSDNVVLGAGLDYLNSIQRTNTDGMILAGDDNIVSNNSFTDNQGGYGIRITGDRNILSGNKFSNNLSGDIILTSTAADNIINVDPKVTITDQGDRNIINGISRNNGDPNTTGAWFGVTKPAGIIIYDFTNNVYYQYNGYTNSRIRTSAVGLFSFNTGVLSTDQAAVGINNGTITATYFTSTAAATIPSTASFFTNAVNGFAFLNSVGTTVLARLMVSGASEGNFGIGLGAATPSSTLDVSNGSAAFNYVAKTTTYAISATDHTIDCTTGTFTVTLPTAVGIKGRVYVITNSGAGTITVATTSSQTIMGASTLTVTGGTSAMLQSTNANWIKLN